MQVPALEKTGSGTLVHRLYHALASLQGAPFATLVDSRFDRLLGLFVEA